MYETSLPVAGNTAQRIACTGFANAIRADGGKCKTVFLQAKLTSAGASLTGNSDVILVGLGADPSTSTTFKGLILSPGEVLTLAIDDLSMLYFRGASGDEVFVTPIL